MSEPVRVQLPDGTQIWARVSQERGPADVGWRDGGGASDVVVARLDDLQETIRVVGSTVRSALADMRPHGVSVEFGIELAIKSGTVISVLTEAAAKASLRVTLSWNDSPPPAAPAEDDDDTRPFAQ
ncbi:CU044_2847 family protein [Actinoplanes sp. GCM10030250]|uniref:CU044_2847 family protein n=1 Tax=Actinoplanes sp. GCM10030250 TaxID=3273376 RepID=UPI00360643D7